ncbi:flavin-containing monooxygenase [Actinophytocola oryzae]|uniref:Cation diffusion facilitator CzcD-associated flavoprotein CzcO n=1 Tax=Actinophytocola oryzae TaxID=502181 RepID=A0A4R7W576_9PSEU|nr:NAD(P)/FAD-dependent oxidoreductase [Actinophytocola oryzae]TDV57375.1 cation diffusion facilitator CzcD-associated flavoprotein CzcO [Actinophytocola oryzae]
MRAPRKPSVAVIGAGFGGLGVASVLRRAGFADVTVLERADDVGGVWRDNTYPGAACDVPSSLYSYSFSPNPDWPRRYAGQPDIHAYLRRTVATEGLRVRCGTEVTGATFEDGRWRIETSTGTVTADVLVPAVGQLSRPAIPDIPGTFAGPTFHSARWDHGVDLAGRRIAVIGTGASAVQFVPRIQPRATRVTVFQRSAPYVVPKPDRAYRPWHRHAFERYPLVQQLGRLATWGVGELLTSALTSHRSLARLVDLLFRVHLRRQVPDRALRERLVPDYEIGCKRLLFSNDWYPALTSPNVDVVTEKITELTPTGVRTADGRAHEADVVVYGTGFAATDFLAPMRIRGLEGRELADEWAGGASAYLGLTVPGFPNMFLVYGPNTNLGGNSVIAMLEGQFAYILDVVRRIVPGSGVDVRREAADRFDAEMRERLGRSAWAGCASWYRDDRGRITTNWPGLVREYRRRTARADAADYRLVTTRTPQVEGA